MSERLRLQLGALLDRYEAAQRAAELHLEKVRSGDAMFLVQFDELRRNVVRPIFEAAGAVLQARGHGFRIVEEPFSAQNGSTTVEAAIELHVAPAGMEALPLAHSHLRALSFATRHYSKTVTIHNGATPHEGSLAGAKGTFALDKIDRQLVEDEVLKLMASLVAAS
jgi:hypothetical protein